MPEPVPPPTTLKTGKSWRQVHLSASFLMLSRHRSTTSLPTMIVEAKLDRIAKYQLLPSLHTKG
jgi:hypothetical protein